MAELGPGQVITPSRQRRDDPRLADPGEYFLAGYLHGRERLEWERQQDR